MLKLSGNLTSCTSQKAIKPLIIAASVSHRAVSPGEKNTLLYGLPPMPKNAQNP
jgi:hypothetical protein